MTEVTLRISLEDAQSLMDYLNIAPSHPLASNLDTLGVLYAYTKLAYEQAINGAANAF